MQSLNCSKTRWARAGNSNSTDNHLKLSDDCKHKEGEQYDLLPK